MLFVGVDPGKRGAMAAIEGDPSSPVYVERLPIPIIKGKKGHSRDEYDLAAIRDLLLRWGRSRGCFVTVEKSQPMPREKGGHLANFQAGVSRGWEWMLTALYVPYQLVHPKTWQKVMHAGTPGEDTKQKSIMAAQRLFPHIELRRTPRSKLLDDGIAEALLLAEYGRRTYGKA